MHKSCVVKCTAPVEPREDSPQGGYADLGLQVHLQGVQVGQRAEPVFPGFEVLEQGMQLIVMPVLIEIVCVVNHKKHVVVSVRHLHFVSAHARLGRLGFFCSFTECTCLALAFYTHC